MNTKLIILLIAGAMVLGLLAWMIVRAWRYRRKKKKKNFWFDYDEKR